MADDGTFSRVAMRALTGALLLMLAACATASQRPVAAKAPPAPTAPAISPQVESEFETFLADFRVKALAEGISPALYDQALGHVTLNPKIQELNAAQPEFTKPVWDYLDGALSARRIADGKEALAENADLFARLEAHYGVRKEILAAIWANESSYGHFMGTFNIFEALATLAFDGPRTGYARPQLLAALKVAQAGPFAPSQMTSSWAGAFGQTQFVPTTWLEHAVDFDGDGKKDLWNSPGDALASAAQLLVNYGWQSGQRWGYEVKLPANFPYEQADLDNTESLTVWRSLGVTTASGAALPADQQSGAIILPAGARGPAFLVFGNFHSVLRYNAAVSYGLAVCLLSDQLAGLDGVRASWPRDEQPLTRAQRMQFQQDLTTLGYDPGAIDGVIGRKVRAALRIYQQARQIPADGFATKSLLDRMESEIHRGN